MTEVTHRVQLSILKRLLFSPTARFSELNKTRLTNDQFSFHLKRLIDLGLVVKAVAGYQLTPVGLEIAGRVNLATGKTVKQPKVSIMVYARKSVEDTNEILLTERQTDPIKGKISLPTSKVTLGESLSEAAKRALKEETGLTAKNVAFAGILQSSHYKSDTPQESAVIVCFRASDLSGKLIRTTKKTKNFWLSLQKAKTLPNTYKGFAKLISLLEMGTPLFEEVIVRE